ncbi:sacsin N-terminal ATP-binding-like domain-containing protein [Nocardia donostiensis]|uniref:ATP-binding protein n=1 Tax=Nocardia donostiensis TaxID=1538463 RepID=A0A1V2TLP5_9NOCA|nr:ATP-binding protein [Nocardia donostiensis]ONM50393.1 ATP-binding protein [Nocardia donostiensis]OQS17373.1 ATP-binding protein [Nocardia donostiensis]OQS18074.1 ATP-binding protein [Nocardia donostiensis]
MGDDPFDTTTLRAGVLTAWRESPTRLREDAATESDLVAAGYRDRLLTELAQNAADAAAKTGVAGKLAVRLDGRALFVANTGAPLDTSGVHALTALRASGKTDTAAVGRFGVGFTAVRTVSDDIELRSTTGSLRFSLESTRQALQQRAIHLPSGLTPPVLRLVWPLETAPSAGYDTEVVLRLRDEVDAAGLLAALRREALDLLVELPALHSIRIGDDEWSATTVQLEGREFTELRITGPGTELSWWQYCTASARWLLPVRGGEPVSAAPDVLRAPTRSDEELSLPALLVADIPMQPDRRRLLPGAHLARLADGYADFARALPPAARLVLVPAPGFARSEADGVLREALVRELREQSWLPVLAVRPDDELGNADSESAVREERVNTAAPARASVFGDLTAELAGLLGSMVAPLVIPELSGNRYREALVTLDVHRLGLARLAELSGGLDREPGWWRSLYSALEPFVHDPLAVEELGALAVPLTDGRLVTGPRTVVLDDQLSAPVPVHWARLVHPDAAHPLLLRLGARQATITDLLSDPGLRDELTEQPGDPDTVDAVLRLAAQADAATLPDWLSLLELPDSEGELLPADELLLPGAPIRELLIPDSPFGTVATAVVDTYGADALRAIGVGWDFGIVSETDPTGPDHHLDAEDEWWAGLAEDPPELVAVRDLDLVDDNAWPQTLRRLLTGARTRPLLADPEGYTAWWLRRYARIDGTALGLFRHPADTEFAGLLPELDIPGLTPADLDALRATLADPNTVTAELAAALLEALADPARTPTPEVASRVHARLAAALDHLDLTDLDPPDQVRALSGAVIDPRDALVLDQPWFGLALPPDLLVVGDMATAPALATLLDLPLVSETVSAHVVSRGRATTWSADPLGVVLRSAGAPPHDDGELVVHDELRVRLDGPVLRTVSVPWWRDGEVTHIQGPRAQH